MDDSGPAYLQVARDLREQIASGALTAGQRIDTNEKLAERYGMAPMTIRSALDVLRGEGLISSQRGRGTFVATHAGEPVTDTGHDPDVQQQIDALATQVQRLTERVTVLERQGSSSDSHATDDA
jgi:DNA-binding GntR family transcriptional regulator